MAETNGEQKKRKREEQTHGEEPKNQEKKVQLDSAHHERQAIGTIVKDPLTPRRILVAGGAGFIGSHLARKLKNEGHFIRIADIASDAFLDKADYCHEFLNIDLREKKNCLQACEGMNWVFNLACDMGGMGFISTNEAMILYNNTQITYNMLDAARISRVERFLYTSSACVYNEDKQKETTQCALKESDAWPAHPQDAYGFEKLSGEVCCQYYGKDFPELQIRIARLHNIYGPYGTWKGGREKAPAALCRKVLCSTDTLEIWGDGEQTRSFCYVDDCIQGITKLMYSDFVLPLNIGSEEMISINDMAKLICQFEAEKKTLKLHHITGPQGVRGRSSDNTLIRQVLKWEPNITLKDGLQRTYTWIKGEIEKQEKQGKSKEVYSSSKVFDKHEAVGTEFEILGTGEKDKK